MLLPIPIPPMFPMLLMPMLPIPMLPMFPMLPIICQVARQLCKQTITDALTPIMLGSIIPPMAPIFPIIPGCMTIIGLKLPQPICISAQR